MSKSFTFSACPNTCGTTSTCSCKWFDNFTFGLSFPGGNQFSVGGNQCTLATHASDLWNKKEMWLMPGCDNIHDGYTYKISVTNTLGVASSGTLITNPDLLSQYNNAAGCTSASLITEPWSMPRSMAIAYKEIELDGISVHLTEVAGSTDLPVKGWSCDTMITLYGFCGVKIDKGPIPVSLWNVVMPVISAGGITDSGGLCYSTLLSEGTVTGTPKVGTNINNSNINLAISVTTSNQTLRIEPISRHISVTVHGSTTNIANMELS